ncbi:hypothetical protein C1H46_038190 [Malus baccata]|uniref:Tafazzin family protein n=1 Tax=Malus baccata TaxID=106549 RepID=A0A540KQK1_MALBA|nr:hypothetical protein C1H46_038190 [Malus baccata]
MGRKIMEWAARSNHMGNILKKMAITTVGGLAKVVVSLLNSTTIHNSNTLLHLVRSRPNEVPFITVSNHMSTMDNPFLCGFKGFPSTDANLARWVLVIRDICFKNSVFSYFFRLGKCIPITWGGGIYQEHMNETLERLSECSWLHFLKEKYTKKMHLLDD